MITIHPVTQKEDINTIEELGAIIWKEHYLPIIGMKQVLYMLNKFQTASVIKKQIDEGAEYYLIKEAKRDIGYMCFKNEPEAVFLSKFYLLKDQRGKGYGKMAMNYIEDTAKTRNLEFIKLTVNKYNTNSIKAYKKIGFEITEEVIFDIGEGYIMDDFRMEKKIL